MQDLVDGVDDEDYWVYGTDSGTPGQFHWCSNGREFEPKEIAWDEGEPNSKFHCVYLKNKGVNKTVLATGDCNTEKRFLCDIRNNGTGGKAMQQECMDIWGITESQ
jgi:Lectin C-type domain